MKTLIINGSLTKRNNGDIKALLDEMKNVIGDFKEINPYYDKIEPCTDCRVCRRTGVCCINDKMSVIYGDIFKNIVIASPIYNRLLTPPLVALASRFQCYYYRKEILNKPLNLKKKTGVLILTGGGFGDCKPAISLAKFMFSQMNATLEEENIVFSLNTDITPACEDQEAIKRVRKVAHNLTQI